MSKRKEQSQQFDYPHIAQRVFDTPLLIDASKLNAILHVLGPRLGFDAPALPESIGYRAPAEHGAALQRVSVQRRDEGYDVADGGIAVVPVIGTLVQRSSWMSSASGMTGYDHVDRMFSAALADPSVREILLEIDSPGGEVAGVFDLADRIFAARGSKYITAIASEYSASAAYLIASAADEVVVPRTGMLGSIGVVMTHYEYSKALEKRGIATTYIFAGKHKVDGNPTEPLPDSVRKDWQAEVDSLYALLTDTVSRNLDIGADRVRGTEAAMFMGQAAVDAGLAHALGTFSEVFQVAVNRQAGPFRSFAQTRQEITMSNDSAGNGGQVTYTAEQLEAARAEARAAGAAGAAGAAEETAQTPAAVAQERARINAIVTHPEAEGRRELAAHLAFNTDMPADQAAALLAKAPKEQAGSPLERAMASETGAIPSQPGPTPAVANVVSINAADVYQRRREQAIAAARNT